MRLVGSLTEISLRGVGAVVCDIDYTLVDFEPAHQAGIVALAKYYGGELSRLVEHYFRLILEGLRKNELEPWAQRDEFNVLVQLMREKQLINKDHPIKIWSRETWLLIAAEKINIPFAPGGLEAARDTYWNAVACNSQLYADAISFTKQINAEKIPLILMAGSDSVLKYSNNGKLIYNPGFSEAYKRKRLSRLPFSYAGLIIGDPIDKPHPDYFNKVELLLKDMNAKKHEVIFVGDSPRNDLEVPASRGYKTFYIKRS